MTGTRSKPNGLTLDHPAEPITVVLVCADAEQALRKRMRNKRARRPMTHRPYILELICYADVGPSPGCTMILSVPSSRAQIA